MAPSSPSHPRPSSSIIASPPSPSSPPSSRAQHSQKRQIQASPTRAFSLNSPLDHSPHPFFSDLPPQHHTGAGNSLAGRHDQGQQSYSHLKHSPHPLYPPGQVNAPSPPSPKQHLPPSYQSPSQAQASTSKGGHNGHVISPNGAGGVNAKERSIGQIKVHDEKAQPTFTNTSTKTRTPAEVYADKHSHSRKSQAKAPPATSAQRQDRDGVPFKDKDKERSAGTKPIFDWIQRKLGARRATISESPSGPRAGGATGTFPHSGSGIGSSSKFVPSPRARLPSMPNKEHKQVQLNNNERDSRARGFAVRGRGGGGPGTRGKNGISGGGAHVHGIGHGHAHAGSGFGNGHGYGHGLGLGMRREDSGSISRVDSRSISISTRSFVGTVERERRREANNPYPSIPIPRLAAAGMVNNGYGHGYGQGDDATTVSMSVTMSLSYLSRSPRSRSRSHSQDSFRSDLSGSGSAAGSRFRRLSQGTTDDMDPPIRRFRSRGTGGGSGNGNGNGGGSVLSAGIVIGVGAGADDDASLRPFPPSHPASPTPSASVLSRTGSNPIFSPNNPQLPYTFGTVAGGTRSRTNTFYSTWSGQDRRSFTSSSLDGYAYRPSSASGYGNGYGYGYGNGYDNDRNRGHGAEDDGDEDYDDLDDEERGRDSRQDSTSTKPTTCISFDSGPGVAHIAQPHEVRGNDENEEQSQTPMLGNTSGLAQSHEGIAMTGSPISIGPHASPILASSPTSPRSLAMEIGSDGKHNGNERGSEIGSGSNHSSPSPSPHTPTTPISPLSAIPSPSPASVSAPHAIVTAPNASPSSGPMGTAASATRGMMQSQAPKHTHPHPVHNPRPSSPPGDNASMLTLASSTFGLVASPLAPSMSSTAQLSLSTPNAAVQPQALEPSPMLPSDDPLVHRQPGIDPHPARLAQVPTQVQDGLARDSPSGENPVIKEGERGVTPPVPPTSVYAQGIVMASPPSIHRLRDPSFTTPLRPPSLSAPSIHWAPVPTSMSDDRPSTASTYDTAPLPHPAGPTPAAPASTYSGSTHLSTAASIGMSLRPWSVNTGGGAGNRADRDASVRAVRRKGSWESNESGWSWRGLVSPGGDTPVTGIGSAGGGGGGAGGGGWTRNLASPISFVGGGAGSAVGEGEYANPISA